MKHICFLLLAIVLLPLTTFGQNNQTKQKVKIGMNCGMNMATWAKDGDAFADDLAWGFNASEGFSGFTCTNNSRIGFNAGLFALIPVTRSFFLQPELMYSQKGTKFKSNGYFTVGYGSNYAVKEDLAMQCDYVDFNLLAKYYLNQNFVRFYVAGGPGLAFLAKSKMKVKVEVAGESDSSSEDFDQFKATDANFNAAAGFEFMESISVEFRYQMGLIPVLDEDEGYKIFNNGMMINFNVIF